MQFPVYKGIVTTGFYDPRPYSKPIAERTNYHRGWDIVASNEAERETVIRAPEAGELIFHLIHRSDREQSADFYWPDSNWYIFSRFFFDTYGCCTILLGESGLTYMFAHQDEFEFYRLMLNRCMHNDMKQSRADVRKSYNKWVQSLLTFRQPVAVKQGAPIGMIGNSGYSTGAHLHMQIHESHKDYGSRIDPAELWPDKYIHDNGNGPVKGVKNKHKGVVG